MTTGAAGVVLRPGEMRLADWRAVLSGADVSLDDSARGRVDAAAATVGRLIDSHTAVYGVNTGFGKLAQTRIDDDDLATLQHRLVVSHAAGVGDPLPDSVVRLMIALKLGSLLRGASGVRWTIVDALLDLLRSGCLPVVPSQGSVGASGDLAPLAHMSAVLIGEGEASVDGDRMPALEALAKVGLEPVGLGPKEGLALLNGTQASTALALKGLFEVEDAFRAALVTGALSLEASKGSVAPFDPRIHALRGHRGQIEVAAALRALLDDSGIVESHRDCERVQDPYCVRCQPQVMGAVLDLLRQAAAVLEIEANAVTDNPLVFPETDEAISGGNFHAEPVAFAADQIAMAACEIGAIAERRIALLTDPSVSGLPAFLSPSPGLNSGFMIAHVTAAALVAENRQNAFPASVDSIPTSANQEDHVSMATHAARRLGSMAANLRHVLSIEFLCGAQGTDFHRPLRSSDRLESFKAMLRERVAGYEEDRYLARDLAEALAVLESPGFRRAAATLPGVTGDEMAPDGAAEIAGGASGPGRP